MANEDYNDYFDGPDLPDPEPETKEPTPEEIEEQQEKEETIQLHPHRFRNIMAGIIALALLTLFAWLYLRYGTPYVTDAQKTGYIQLIEKRGYIFKTFEGDMITEFAIHDSSKVYQRDFAFSIDNDSIARQAMQLQGTGKKVTLTYKEYAGMLPWRGSSRCIVTNIEQP